MRTHRPWENSIGPRTGAGKAQSRMNALQHGEFSAAKKAIWRELNDQLRVMAKHERDCENALDGVTIHPPARRDERWVNWIAEELNLTNFSRELLLERFGSTS